MYYACAIDKRHRALRASGERRGLGLTESKEVRSRGDLRKGLPENLEFDSGEPVHESVHLA